ncbi:hypothetical protein C8A03DRAFT_16721 [Achaetomium macrosporum]|uniref:Autophagy-related protein 28 n=1 Tax=Achaetomium macrosporum TaxID=79813 RepID=A0AAN7C7I4_9PEZI|nr:hypothetical protein C8A03DRAFT_16721 [Achaetomium macrosporum]
MPAASSFLPRLGLSRGDGPILPLHRTSPPIRRKSSEYDLSELSPRPHDGLLSSDPTNSRRMPVSSRRSSSPSARYSDRESNPSSASKSKPTQRILFAGPPPPIATSQILYRDEEDRDTSLPPYRGLEASSFARNINSVLFDRGSHSPSRSRDGDYDYKPNAVWLNLQRRERALQKDLQHLLDAQSTGLAANLDPQQQQPPTSSLPSDSSSSSTRRKHVAFDPTTNTTTTSSGTLVPVRQPRPPKPLGLRAARAGLARTIALLADLKAEEDAQLTSALSTRKQALSQLRRLSARREGIAEELRVLESEEGDEGQQSLGRELRELEGEREAVAGEIAELEERLAGLKKRQKWLDGRVEEVRSRREAGLSSYKGALKEVEGRIAGLLARPAVRPLDVELFSQSGVAEGDPGESPGGVEFLHLRPERRTVEMARDWWEGEVRILERRKAKVDKERAALEQGVEVWKETVKLVSEFEAGLRREMSGGGDVGETGNGKGKGRESDSASPEPPPPDQAMYALLDKMRVVMASLEERLHIAEEKGWNLLICAIGAELEAFRQAESMLVEALRAAGFDPAGEQDDGEQGDSTPYLGGSTSLRNSVQWLGEASADAGPGKRGNLVDLHEEEEREPESDNEVPPDLLVSAEDDRGLESPALSREDSGNEVPMEFLREHRDDRVYPQLVGMN